MRVVIPGGSGYLGGRIAEHLHNQGHQVRVCSRRARAWAGPSKDIEVVGLDWRDDASVNAALSGADALVMLAAANEIEAARDPVGAADATTTQCLAWLLAAKRHRVRRFVYMSTIHVYGSTTGPFIDEDTPARPNHPYASTHLAAELFVKAAHRSGGPSSIIFRLSNAFGAPVDPAVNRWSLLVNDLARQAVKKAQLNLITDGTQSRDFIGMSAVCAAVNWSLTQPVDAEEALVLNLASGEPTSVYNMASRIAQRASRFLGRTPEVVRPAPDDRLPPGRAARYDVSRLQARSFDVKTDADQEIDGLLQFCVAHREYIGPDV